MEVASSSRMSELEQSSSSVIFYNIEDSALDTDDGSNSTSPPQQPTEEQNGGGGGSESAICNEGENGVKELMEELLSLDNMLASETESVDKLVDVDYANNPSDIQDEQHPKEENSQKQEEDKKSEGTGVLVAVVGDGEVGSGDSSISAAVVETEVSSTMSTGSESFEGQGDGNNQDLPSPAKALQPLASILEKPIEEVRTTTAEGSKRAAVNLRIPVMPMFFRRPAAPSTSSQETTSIISENPLNNKSEDKKSDKTGAIVTSTTAAAPPPKSGSDPNPIVVDVSENEQPECITLDLDSDNDNDYKSNYESKKGSNPVPTSTEHKKVEKDTISYFEGQIEKPHVNISSTSKPPETASPPKSNLTSTLERSKISCKTLSENHGATTSGGNGVSSSPLQTLPSPNHREENVYNAGRPIYGQQIRCNSDKTYKVKVAGEKAELSRYKCLVCGLEGFNQFQMFKSHREQEHPDVPFVVNNEKPFACGVCGKPFHLRRDALVCAILGHDATSLRKQMFRYACSQCPKDRLSFHSVIALKQHWETVHCHIQLDATTRGYEDREPLPTVIINEEEAQKIKSGEFPEGSEFLLIIEKDLISNCNKADGPDTKHIHICTICNAKLNTNYELNNHMQKHTAPPPKKPIFKCIKCQKEFNKPSDLRRHFQIHLSSHKKSDRLRLRKETGKVSGSVLGRVDKRGRPRKHSESATSINTKNSTDNTESKFTEGSGTVNKKTLKLAKGIRNAIKSRGFQGKNDSREDSKMSTDINSKGNPNSDTEQQIESPEDNASTLPQSHSKTINPFKLFKCTICKNPKAFTTLIALKSHKRFAHQLHPKKTKREIKPKSYPSNAEILSDPGFIKLVRCDEKMSRKASDGGVVDLRKNKDRDHSKKAKVLSVHGKRKTREFNVDLGPNKKQLKVSSLQEPTSNDEESTDHGKRDLSGSRDDSADLQSTRIATSSPRVKFQCKICLRFFLTQYFLNKHQKDHAEKSVQAENNSPAGRGRGRPRKRLKTEVEKEVDAPAVFKQSEDDDSPTKKGPGRPRKNSIPQLVVSSVAQSFMKKRSDSLNVTEETGRANEEKPGRLSLHGKRDRGRVRDSGRKLADERPSSISNISELNEVSQQYLPILKEIKVICTPVDVKISAAADRARAKAITTKPLKSNRDIKVEDTTTTSGTNRALYPTSHRSNTEVQPKKRVDKAKIHTEINEKPEPSEQTKQKRGRGRPAFLKKWLPTIDDLLKSIPSVSPPPSPTDSDLNAKTEKLSASERQSRGRKSDPASMKKVVSRSRYFTPSVSPPRCSTTSEIIVKTEELSTPKKQRRGRPATTKKVMPQLGYSTPSLSPPRSPNTSEIDVKIETVSELSTSDKRSQRSGPASMKKSLPRSKDSHPSVTFPLSSASEIKVKIEELPTPKKQRRGRPASKKSLPKSESKSSVPAYCFAAAASITKEIQIIIPRCDESSHKSKIKMNRTKKGSKTPKESYKCSSPISVNPNPVKCQMLMFKKDSSNFVDIGSTRSVAPASTTTNFNNKPETKKITSPSNNSKTFEGDSIPKPASSRKRGPPFATHTEEVKIKKKRSFDNKHTFGHQKDYPRAKKDVFPSQVSVKYRKSSSLTSSSLSPNSVDERRETHPCKSCSRSFPTEKTLRQHLVMAHMSPGKVNKKFKGRKPKVFGGVMKPALLRRSKKGKRSKVN